MKRVGDWVRRSLVVVLLGLAALAAAYGLNGRGRAADARTDGPALATPLWSPRRLPQPAVSLAAGAALQRDLDAAFTGIDGCVAVGDATGTVAAIRPDQPYVPASTEKLLTAATALAVLGPDYRYETRAVAAGPPADGVIDRLWLVGGGDPLLATSAYVAWNEDARFHSGNAWTSLEQLADAIVQLGVQSIPGGVVGDDARFDELRVVPSWKASYHAQGEAGSLGGLVVNGGYDNFAARIPADDPALHAAGELTSLLADRGVTVGDPGRGAAPEPGNVIAAVQSPPLTDVVGEMMRASDNTTAELVLKEIAFAKGGPASSEHGAQVVRETLAGLSVPVDALTTVDGSGLDRNNRVTCAALLGTLTAGARPELRGLWDGLSVAGQRGTLELSFRGTPLEGNLRGKTGTLNGVAALAGLFDLGTPVRFAIVLNGELSEAAGLVTREELVTTIARYPQAPPPDQVVPPPVAPTE